MAASTMTEYSASEVAKHDNREDVWLIIKDTKEGDLPKVYNISKYLDDHPGGAEVMLEQAGQDATDMFEDIGHSQDARQSMKKFLIGTLVMTDEERAKLAAAAEAKALKAQRKGGGLNPLAVLAMLVAIVLGYIYSQRSPSVAATA